MRKELYFGFSIMAAIVIGTFIAMPSFSEMTNGHLGLLMLSLVVVTIMLGFPTAFTLMGMGMIFALFAFLNQGEGTSQAIDRLVGFAIDVKSRLQHQVVCRCNHCGRLFGYFDSAICDVDCVWCDCGCVSG